jgi:hypothetical protein
MSVDAKAPEGHVVAATSPFDATCLLGPALYAVVTDTREHAEAAVRVLVSPQTIVEAAGGPLNPETVARLALVVGEVKQIG